MFTLSFYKSPKDSRVCGYTCAEWFVSDKEFIFAQTPFGATPEAAITTAVELQKILNHPPIIKGTKYLSPKIHESIATLTPDFLATISALRPQGPHDPR